MHITVTFSKSAIPRLYLTTVQLLPLACSSSVSSSAIRSRTAGPASFGASARARGDVWQLANQNRFKVEPETSSSYFMARRSSLDQPKSIYLKQLFSIRRDITRPFLGDILQRRAFSCRREAVSQARQRDDSGNRERTFTSTDTRSYLNFDSRQSDIPRPAHVHLTDIDIATIPTHRQATIPIRDIFASTLPTSANCQSCPSRPRLLERCVAFYFYFIDQPTFLY